MITVSDPTSIRPFLGYRRGSTAFATIPHEETPGGILTVLPLCLSDYERRQKTHC